MTVAKVSRKRELWLVVSVNKISVERIEKEIGVMDREAAKRALQSEKASGFFKEMLSLIHISEPTRPY